MRRFVPISDISSAAKLQFRGRDASYLAPPAQIRTCGFPAYGSHLGYRRQFGAVNEPTSCATLTRLGVRRVLSWRAFPSVPALRSTNSAADPSALFVSFPATMACGTAMRGAVALPGSKATSRAKGSHRKLGGLASGRQMLRERDGPHREGEEPYSAPGSRVTGAGTHTATPCRSDPRWEPYAGKAHVRLC